MWDLLPYFTVNCTLKLFSCFHPYPLLQDQMCRTWPQRLSTSTHCCSSVREPSANRRTSGRRSNERRTKAWPICSPQARKRRTLGFYLLFMARRKTASDCKRDQEPGCHLDFKTKQNPSTTPVGVLQVPTLTKMYCCCGLCDFGDFNNLNLQVYVFFKHQVRRGGNRFDKADMALKREAPVCSLCCLWALLWSRGHRKTSSSSVFTISMLSSCEESTHSETAAWTFLLYKTPSHLLLRPRLVCRRVNANTRRPLHSPRFCPKRRTAVSP